MPLRIIALVGALLAGACTAQPQQSCCKLDFKGEAINSGVRITITNTASEPVFLTTSKAYIDFKFELLDAQGQRARMTSLGQKLLTPDNVGGSRIRVTLLPGEGVDQVLDLKDLFDLEPGMYTLIVSRQVKVGQRPIVISGRTTLSLPMPDNQ